MNWHMGLQRLRLVGTIALVLGVLSFAAVYITNLLGYAPDASVQPLFSLMGRVGLLLTILGGLLTLAAWVIQGFAPAPAPSARVEPEPRRARLSE